MANENREEARNMYVTVAFFIALRHKCLLVCINTSKVWHQHLHMPLSWFFLIYILRLAKSFQLCLLLSRNMEASIFRFQAKPYIASRRKIMQEIVHQ